MKIINKNNKGITLISLVVTIVILIILAGVAIATLTGENGIITKAREAKVKTEQGKREEELLLNEYEDMVNGEYVEIEQVNDTTPGFMEGTGTEEDPFTINSIEDLVYFANQVKNGVTYSGQFVDLGISLDFNSEKSYMDLTKKYYLNQENMMYEETEDDGKNLKECLVYNQGWMPIGDIEGASDLSFAGTFDGNGNIIKNLYINNQVEKFSCFGLFAINKGKIKNINIFNANITVNGVDNIYIFVGTLCGSNQGNINNIVTEGNINYTGNYGVVGGVVAENSTGKTINNCLNKVNIKSNSMYAGGIIGTNLGIIENCVNYGDIYVEDNGSYVGGIAGLSNQNESEENTYVKSCYNKGDVCSIGNKAGGIVGYNLAPIIACYNGGTVKGNIFIGGIVGYTNKLISNSYNIGKVESLNEEGNKIGGIVGYIDQHGAINCYNEGSITYKNGDIVGGVMGYVVDNCFPFKIGNNFYFNDIEKGIGYITPENENYAVKLEKKMDKNTLLQLLNTGEENWVEDVNNINNGYPILKWQEN